MSKSFLRDEAAYFSHEYDIWRSAVLANRPKRTRQQDPESVIQHEEEEEPETYGFEAALTDAFRECGIELE